MYSRSFYPTEGSSPPENYSGTAFSEPAPLFDPPLPDSSPDEPALSNSVTENFEEGKEKSEPAGLFNIPLLSGLLRGSGLGGTFSDLFSKIGIEEILIIAVAAFLFFSKDGDTECAILLLLLLFVK